MVSRYSITDTKCIKTLIWVNPNLGNIYFIETNIKIVTEHYKAMMAMQQHEFAQVQQASKESPG